jgi:UDP-glucose 4-epimerase
MRVLVTGGAGFIGRHITEYFQHRAEVRVLDNLRSGLKSNLSGLNCQFMIGSILDRDLVTEAMKGVDFVFHLAAIASVQESIQKPNECAEINTRGTVIVLEEAARAGAKKLILSSSAAIYGDNPINPQVESMPPEPKSPSPLFPFVILMFLVPTRIREANTARSFQLLLRKQSGTSRLRFSETASRRETSSMWTM